MKKRYLEAGKIVGTHGVRGEVKIKPWADSAHFLLGFKFFYVDDKPVGIKGARVHKDMVLANLEGVCDVNAAMALKGRVVFIDREEALLPEGDFFIQDIIGAVVATETGEELGTLSEVLELPAGNVYVVKGSREYMIPAVPEFVLETDAGEGKIIVRVIEGM